VIVALAFYVCPELGASFRSQGVQIILQLLGIFGEFLTLEVFRWRLIEEATHKHFE
jgi:hypothetical protein